MANKKVEKTNIFENVDTLISKAKTFNKEAIKTTDMLVEEGLATGVKFQKIFAKSIVKGTDLLEKQQDITVENLTELKNLYVSGTQRFKTLFNIDQLSDSVKGIANKAVKNVEGTISDLEDGVKANKKSVLKSTISIVKDVKSKAADMISNVTKETKAEVKAAKKVAKKATAKRKSAKSKKAKLKKAVAKNNVEVPAVEIAATTKATSKLTTKAKSKGAPKKSAKRTTKSIAAKVTAAKTNLIEYTDLKVISGVGPKMEILLQDAGYNTIKDVAKSSQKRIQAVLDAGGSRYRRFEPKQIIQSAKEAI